MKTLVLRIYNSKPEYDFMKDVHMKYDNSIFVVLDSTLQRDWNYNSEKRLLEIKGDECIVPGTRIKTLKALEICLSLFEFDYLVRSNISTVINLKLLEEKLGYLNGKSVYGGHVWNLQHEDIPAGITKQVLQKYYNLQFVSGTSIILSRDNCQYLVDNQNRLTDSIVDDVAIAVVLKDKEQPNLFLRFQDGPSQDKNCVFFRFRRDNDRLNDYLRMTEQYEFIRKLNEEQYA